MPADAFPLSFHTTINGERIVMDCDGPKDGRVQNYEQCDGCGGGEFTTIWSGQGLPLSLVCDQCGNRYTMRVGA